MSIKNKLMEFILKRSNSYQYYKSQYEKYIEPNKNLWTEVNGLKRDFNQYKKTTTNYLDSYNFLFNNLYLDYEFHPKNLLKNIQLLTNELLEFVGNVCDKYDLEWWLDYGNLLGAVRHGDYVPWDDDADIGMMRKDYIKFDNVIQSEIDSNNLTNLIYLSYKPRKIDGDTINSFIQILFRHSNITSYSRQIIANVDIFPYDFINDYDKVKLDELYIKTRTNLYRNISKKLSLEKCLNQYYGELNLNFNETELVIPGVEGACGSDNMYDLFIIESSKIFPLDKIKFGNKICPCPKDSNYYLDKVYGDYMKVPKNLHRHDRINNLRYSENKNEVFENCINLLKEVNSKY